MPVIAPVVVLKLRPFPITGEIVKLSIVPPVDVMDKPVIADPAVALSEVTEREMVGEVIVGDVAA